MKLTRSNGLNCLLIFFCLGSSFLLKADVVVLNNGVVMNGKILQQDSSGILLQTQFGAYRYPSASIQEAKQEASAAPHVSNNGQAIPDWAQIVSLLADTGWAPAIQQVPATVIGHGNFKNVPFISFRCGYGDYEINIFGDLNKPAAVQVGAMNYLHQTAAEKTNCINFICSVLAHATDRKMVRALDWNHKDMQAEGAMSFETLMPGEMDSYGGWWVSVYNTNALAAATASDTELTAITQTRAATLATNAVSGTAAPANAGPQPATTTTTTYETYGYGTEYGWTAEEIAAAHPGTTYPTANGANVYPRTYNRTDGSYHSYHR